MLEDISLMLKFAVKTSVQAFVVIFDGLPHSFLYLKFEIDTYPIKPQ